ncbi:MAG: Ig-like domain-containing protein [Acidobacteria bacterium]|nr:Ig-like domain-containing protein [Acidobacteriota bacterium]
MPARCAGAVLGAALALLLAPPAWATDTICDGTTRDAGGYTCTLDATDRDWIPDVSGDGTEVTSWKPNDGGDDSYRSVTLPSAFRWYGNTYSTAFIGSNGYVAFGSGQSAEVSGALIPDASSPNNAVYGYGDDLDVSAGGTVYHMPTTCLVDRDADGEDDLCYVIQWDSVPDFNGTGEVSLQIALDLDTHEAIVEIEDESTTDLPNLVGTENSAGTIGLWYKAAGDGNSRGVTAGDQFIFGPDLERPSVTTTSPGNEDEDVALSENVVIDFDEPMATASVALAVLGGTNPGGWTPAWSNGNQRVTYSHNPFGDDEQVSLQVTGTDVSGNALNAADNGVPGCGANAYCWSFSTLDMTGPAAVTKLTAASGDLSVTPEWLNPPDGDFAGVLVLQQAGSVVTDAPVNGDTYTVGQALGTSTVVCVTDDVDATSCTDVTVTNGIVYHYKAFPYDTNQNYGAGAATTGYPRASATFKWAYTSSATSLAPVGAVAAEWLVAIGNDRLLHRMSEVDGTRDGWEPPAVGGAVQARPMVGELITDGVNQGNTGFVASQNGYLYRFDLDNDIPAEASRNVAGTGGDAGCTAGLLQAAPVVVVDEYDTNPNDNDDVVIVATRCGAADNKIVMYDHALTTKLSEYAGTDGTLGISNGQPLIIYRPDANNIVVFPVRDEGGESVVLLEVNSTPAFATPPWGTITGIGDIDAAPTLVERGTMFLALGNTAGTVYLYDPLTVAQIDTISAAIPDGPVKGVDASTRISAGPNLWENWFVWSTDSRVHCVKIGADGRFTDATYSSIQINGPSVPLVLRYVGGAFNTRAYVGSADGRLYELDATTCNTISSPLIEGGKTVGDPTFDYNDGTTQGIVVGTTNGTIHWVKID